jgi:hypothetical protein
MLLALDAQLTDRQAGDLEIADFERSDLGASDREPADGEPADGKRADRDGAPGERADGDGADRSAAECAGDTHAEALGVNLAALDTRTAARAHGLAAIVAAAAPPAGRVEWTLTARAGEATVAGAALRWFSYSERPT